MRKLILAAFIFASTISSNVLADIKMGIILGFTGPIESLTPGMRDSAKMAFDEASNSGALLGGKKITVELGDSTCTDASAAQAAAEKLVAAGVAAIMGADCSGVTKAIAENIAVPNGVVMISPSATSPSLTDINDNGFFFRTAPSDKRGGQILADITKDRGIKSVAITYENSDYGKGLAENVQLGLEKHGIKITTTLAHENGKADYASEVATLAAAGGDALAVLGYADQGGKGVIQAALDSGAFDTFILGDGMIAKSLVATFGKDLSKSFGSMPGSLAKGAQMYEGIAKAAGVDPNGAFVRESYDAAALIVLAVQAGNSADRKSIAKNVMSVANAPGIKIYPGELKKGLELLAKGTEIDYEGASSVTFTDVGEAGGSFLEMEVKGNDFKGIKQR
jgi:branched-chain amino acid transport system substrate-binding protein